MLNPPVDAPLHSVIRNELLADIRSGRLQPGDQVPTEPVLIERFKVSRTTVRRALRDLEMMGLISRQAGRGSFVREPQLEPRLDRLSGFAEDMDALGLVPSARVITIEDVLADPEVAAQLQLRPGESVVHVARVRLANGQPISFDDSYLRKGLGDRLASEDLENEPFYEILERKYNVGLSSADYVVSATRADEQVAGLLGAPVGAAVLLMERVSFVTTQEEPLMFEYLHYRGDRMRYRLRVER